MVQSLSKINNYKEWEEQHQQQHMYLRYHSLPHLSHKRKLDCLQHHSYDLIKKLNK